MNAKHAATGRQTMPDLRRALERLEEVAQDFNAPDLAQRAADAREPLERGEIWVVVVGQFKRGKSMLLNALLGDVVLPTGVVPVTSVVTHIRWAPEPGLRVVFADGRESAAPLSALSDFVSEEGNPSNHRGVALVEVGLTASLLEGGLVLVDTPGIGSMDVGSTGRAYAFLPRVDAAILVLSPDPPIGQAEGAYLEALLEHTEHLLFVLNKVDLHPEAAWKEALAFNRRGLAEIQGVPEEEVDLLPISSILALRGPALNAGDATPRAEKGASDPEGQSPCAEEGASDPMDSSEGGIRQLREMILQLVRKKGEEVSRNAALRRLDSIAGELSARLRVEENAIRLSDGNLADRLTRLEELRRELALRREEVRPVLLDASRRLAEHAAVSLRARAASVQDSLVGAVKSTLEEQPRLGNAGLVRSASAQLTLGVRGAFDAWWAENGEELRGRLKEAMTRAANGVDATGSSLASWVEEEIGVRLPTPPPPMDLVESHHFYYHVQGMKPELTIDLLGLLLPRPIFRWRLRRKAPRLVGEDLERNVGRIRGDLLYRAQETVRGFFAELEKRAVAAEEGIETALRRASRAHAGAREEGTAALARLLEGAEALEALLGDGQGEDLGFARHAPAAHESGEDLTSTEDASSCPKSRDEWPPSKGRVPSGRGEDNGTSPVADLVGTRGRDVSGRKEPRE